MFDPSKLNLDLNDEKKENGIEKSDEFSDKINIRQSQNEKNREKNKNENNQEKIDDRENKIDILEQVLIDNNDDGKNTEENKQDLKNKKKKEENQNTEENKEEDKITENKNTIIEQNINDKKQKAPLKEEIITKKDLSNNEQTNEKLGDKIIENNNENKIIYDININSIQDLFIQLIENKYDFLTIEPNEQYVKIGFRKDKIERQVKYIRYPIYSNILIKAKNITKLNVEENKKGQEGVGKIILKEKSYKVIIKTIAGDLGEKVFLKVEETKEKVKKEKKKTSLGQIFGFIISIIIIGLILGGSFLTYVVLNAKTIEDVQFFYSLGINLNDINTFIEISTSIIFSILLFLESIFLIIVLFKFLTTKKEFKQRKIKYGIFSIIFLIICFTTASFWMFVYKKVNALPNWQEMSYGDIQIYDNSKLISEYFNKGGSLIEDTSNLIGPVEIKFDLDYFAQKEEKNNLKIKNFIWDFNGEIIETPNSSIIQKFDKKGIYNISLVVQEVDIKGDILEKVVENIPSIGISYIVNKEEEKTDNGGLFVKFDANDLKQLGKIEWYYIENLENPIITGYNFYSSKPIFKETIIGMNIINKDDPNDKLDKVFIINGEENSNINGEITSVKSIENYLEYELKVENVILENGNGYIEKYKWIIDGKEFSKNGDINNPTESSKIKYEFKNPGKYKVKVLLTDSAGNNKELNTIIDITKKLKLASILNIYNNNKLIEDIEYNKENNEYFINELGIPTELKLDARYIKSLDNLYSLEKVSWDFDSNGDIDDKNNLVLYNVTKEGNHKITVNYKFVHKAIKDDIINVEEIIYIEGVKKEAIIDFEINKSNNYIPAIVSFDGSKSIVKNENIVKFIWDYGDGIIEERDAVVFGHKYLKEGEYRVNLKVITETGKVYEKNKILVLKPKPQSIKITSSMKKTFIGQAIDFSSKDSQGQIISYLWDFGDGNTSTQANPSHFYNKAGNYKVTLEVDFVNNNVLQESINIEITE